MRGRQQPARSHRCAGPTSAPSPELGQRQDLGRARGRESAPSISGRGLQTKDHRFSPLC